MARGRERTAEENMVVWLVVCLSSLVGRTFCQSGKENIMNFLWRKRLQCRPRRRKILLLTALTGEGRKEGVNSVLSEKEEEELPVDV